MTRRLRGAQERRPIYHGFGGKVAKAIDSAVGLVAPNLAHGMRKARMRSEAMLAYEAAEVSRLSPREMTHSADSAILPDLQVLRNVSRKLTRDDPHASSAISLIEESIVGHGIVPRSNATARRTGMSETEVQAWNEACDAVWERWCEEDADATGDGSFYDVQALALRTWFVDGEVLGHLVMRDGTISCELIDADRLWSPGGRDTDTVRGGVERDSGGRSVAFYFLPSHPADMTFGAAFTVQPTRIVAEMEGLSIVQHGYRKEAVGQSRGVPRLTPGAEYLRHLHHYLGSELIAARASSNYALFIKRNINETDTDLLPVQGMEEDTAAQQEYHETLEPGTIEYLNEGEEPVPFTPNRPGSSFEPFTVRMLRAACASFGVSYELVCKDLGRMNLSSARAMLRECHRGFDLARSRFVRAFCRPWWRNVMLDAIRRGELQPPSAFLEDPSAFMSARWVAPGYGMVDPVTDVEGSRKACDANLSTPWAEAAKWGTDLEHVMRERARAFKLAAQLERENGLEPGTLTKESPERIESSSRQQRSDGSSAEQKPSDTETPEPQPPEEQDDDSEVSE
jgi:lambda family phage portal protein